MLLPQARRLENRTRTRGHDRARISLIGSRGCVWGLALTILTGCSTLPEPERVALRQAAQDYTAGRRARAVPVLDRIIRDYPQMSEVAEAFYVRGLCHAAEGRQDQAVRDFERAIRQSKRDDLTARAQASRAAIAYRQGDWRTAADFYARATRKLPDEPPTDEILFCAGVSLQRVGRWDEARLRFGRILRTFASGPIAAQARRLATWRHPYYAIQLGAFEQVDGAADAVRKYRQANLAAMEENLPRNGKAMWVVMAGQYRTYADARAALSQARQVQPQAFIIPRVN